MLKNTPQIICVFIILNIIYNIKTSTFHITIINREKKFLMIKLFMIQNLYSSTSKYINIHVRTKNTMIVKLKGENKSKHIFVYVYMQKTIKET